MKKLFRKSLILIPIINRIFIFKKLSSPKQKAQANVLSLFEIQSEGNEPGVEEVK